MVCDGYDRVLDLGEGDLIELSDARGTTLRVTKGALWITQERDRRDVVLRTGDVWTVERQGLTIIEAQDAATVCLVGIVAELAHSRSRRVRLAMRVNAFVRSLGEARFGRRSAPYY
jgi:hypothetical protein